MVSETKKVKAKISETVHELECLELSIGSLFKKMTLTDAVGNSIKVRKDFLDDLERRLKKLKDGLSSLVKA
mgnify:CR=1 FL=1